VKRRPRHDRYTPPAIGRLVLPACIKGHTRAASRAGATPQELMKAIWVAAEMRAGAAYAHAALMLDMLQAETDKH
jgi:alkylhydroperoxidase/carboxymuconolactone decarboxylase family protein YurZ